MGGLEPRPFCPRSATQAHQREAGSNTDKTFHCFLRRFIEQASDQSAGGKSSILFLFLPGTCASANITRRSPAKGKTMVGIASQAASRANPLWRRIYEFPLVAMVVGALLWCLSITIAGITVILAKPQIPSFSFEMKIYSLAILILVPLYIFAIAKLGNPRRNDFRDPKWLRHLLLGLVGGTVIFSIAVAIAGALGIYRIVGVGSLNGLLGALIVPTIGAAVTEEMLFRGILFRWLEQFGGSWAALLLTSAFFGAAHLNNPNASWIAAAGIAVEAGVMLGAAYMLTRSLWLPMGLHGAWNFTQGEIYDIPVSGTKADGMVDAQLSGAPLLTGNGFGLEASVIAITVATAFGLWLLWLAIRKGQLVSPMWVRRRAMTSAITD
jgi:membrane protease YdiL (CAAX protease family)